MTAYALDAPATIRMLELYLINHWSVGRIARQLGVNTSTVEASLEAHGGQDWSRNPTKLRAEFTRITGHTVAPVVPVIVRPDMRPDAVLAAMLIENGQRTDLDPIEEARAMHRLKVQLDCSSSELAGKVGRNQAFVDGRLTLLQLPVEEQELLRTGQMTLGEAQRRSRETAGTARPKGYTGAWYLGTEHTLADRARSRCQRIHKRPRLLARVACGECWESVIRADEREHLHTHTAKTGVCALCGGQTQ